MDFVENRNRSWVPYLILIPITLPIFILYVWLFLSSFSNGMEGIIPESLTISNWQFLWKTEPGHTSIWGLLANTFVFAFSIAIFELFVASAAAYAISRLNFPGRRFLLSFMIVLHAFPSVTLLIAIFFILRAMGLYDTLLGVILIKLALELPFAIWIMKGFFDNVSWDIEIAAMVDGASRFKIWRTIMIPIVGPGLAAVSIFAFLSGWSEFLLPYIFTPSSTNQVLSVFLNSLMSQADTANYGFVTAVGVFYIIPILLFYIFTQKYLLNIYSGGVKG